jgi:hypothetical protein
LTTPIISPTSIFAPPPPPEAEVTFPIGWLLNNASAPIQYRAINDVVKPTDGTAFPLGVLPLAYKPALELAVQADVNGVWNRSMLTLPSKTSERFEGIGTIPATRRLLEYGWDKDSPPVVHTKRVLFRLLAEDNDPDFLYELRSTKKVEEEVTLSNRQLLREAAAATLATAGFEADPRLRGLARRTIERIAEFLRSPLAEKPWIRVGNKQVLHPDAAPPSIYALHLIAHMPLFQSEHYEAMELLFAYLSRPLPRQESIQQVGASTLMPVPYAVLGDQLPHRNAVEDDVPKALAWLELMARLGFLRRNETWTKMYERFVDDCGRDGVWHPHKGLAMPKSSDPYVWPMFPLEQAHGGDERWCDVTFRIGLIARLAGRPINLI